MSLTVTSPVTGGAQTGFTTPAYILAADTAPNNNGKQYAVSGITGTQTGVDSSSTPTRPFTLLVSKPPVLRQLPSLNSVTGILGNVPRNVYKVYCRKGVTVLTNQVPQVASASVELSIPAGADLNDAPNIRAMISLLIGSLNQISAGIGDTTVTGVM
jgi:hypothetical protein